MLPSSEINLKDLLLMNNKQKKNKAAKRSSINISDTRNMIRNNPVRKHLAGEDRFYIVICIQYQPNNPTVNQAL